MKTQKRWKFLRTGLVSDYKNFKWEIGKIGKWYSVKGKVSTCKNGFHCSKEIGQAFSYVKGEILAEVEVRGESDVESDKDAWQEMKIVKAYNWEKINSVNIAIYSAKLCLENYEKLYPNDTRVRDAIKAAEKWAKNPTEENATAARSAADSAYSAAYSAYSAAYSAARSAVDSAYSAARSAAYSAYSAADSARSAAYSAYSAADSARSAADSARSAALKKIYKAFDREVKKLIKYDTKSKK